MRVNRVRLARLLHKLPAEIDAAPLADIADLIAVEEAEAEVRQIEQYKARGRGRGRGR